MGFRFNSGSQKQKFKGSDMVWVQEFEIVNSTYVLVVLWYTATGAFFKTTGT